MILKLFLALFFTNIFGFLFDYMEGSYNALKRKFYLNSIPQIIFVLFFRNIAYVLNIFTFRKKEVLNSVSIVIFITSVFFLLNTKIEYGQKFSVLYFLSVVLWATIYSYLAISSKFLYEGNLNQGKKLTERELKMYSDEATKKDKLILFSFNFLSSFISFPIYILSLIMVLYVYLIDKIIG